MGRTRNTKNRDLPPNLYVRKDGYYSYRDPRTGQEYGLGRNKRDAINQAIEVNIELTNYSSTRLINRINNENLMSVSDWCDKYLSILIARGIKQNTIRAYSTRMNAIKSQFNFTPLIEVSTKEIAVFINSYAEQGKAMMGKLIRSLLNDMFREAIATGIIENNPVTATRNPKVEVQRDRLSLDDYLAIRKMALTSKPWVAIGMDLALLTGQRVGDVEQLKWSDISGDTLFIEQQKTGMKLAIPLNTGLEALELTIADVLKECERIGGKNSFLIKSSRKANKAVTSLSASFSDIRDKVKLKWDGDPASFHEIRSLSARLYTEQHDEKFAQKLLGHKSSSMTDKYRDVRGSEWIEVK